MNVVILICGTKLVVENNIMKKICFKFLLEFIFNKC